MNKKELRLGLIERGFKLDKYRNLEKEIAGTSVKVTIYSGLFSKKIKMIGIFYKFNKDLEIGYHQGLFDKSIKCLEHYNSNLEMGALGFDFIEASILDDKVLANITPEEVENSCILFNNTIIPLVKEYGL